MTDRVGRDHRGRAAASGWPPRGGSRPRARRSWPRTSTSRRGRRPRPRSAAVRRGRRHRRRSRSRPVRRARSTRYGRVDIAFNNAGISPPEDDSILTTGPGRLAPGAGGQPDLGLPVLQVRHPAHAAAGQGLDHQHRLVRGRARRGHLADLLHRVQGRRAGHDPRARACSSPARASGSTRCARARSTRRCCRSCSPRTRSGRRGGWCTYRWAGSAEPDEIAAAVAFLASDDSSFITASTFLVDGGISGAYVTPL